MNTGIKTSISTNVNKVMDFDIIENEVNKIYALNLEQYDMDLANYLKLIVNRHFDMYVKYVTEGYVSNNEGKFFSIFLQNADKIIEVNQILNEITGEENSLILFTAKVEPIVLDIVKEFIDFSNELNILD